MKKALEVEILGQKFTISSDADEAYMLAVAGYVDRKMQELSRSGKNLGKSNIAMVAALNIADDFHRLKEAHEAMLQKVNALSNRISVALSEEG